MELEMPPLHPGQQSVWDSDARFKVVCCGRRWGKTHLGVAKCIRTAARRGRAWWVAPTYPIAEVGWRLVKSICAPIPGLQLREGDRMITLPGGGVIQVKSADRPDSLRGEALDYVVLDEVADIKPDAWFEALRPTLADRKGGALFIGTPRGQDNWFYDLFQRAEKDNKIWKCWQQPTRSNPFIPEDEIVDMTRDMGSVEYAQECLAEFVVPGGAVFRPDWKRYYLMVGEQNEFRYDTSIVMAQGAREYETYPLMGSTRFATVDLAFSTKTSADFTVISAWSISPKLHNLAHLDQIRERMEAPEVIPAMWEMMKRWRLAYIAVENVAAQLGIIQIARREGLPVRAVRPDKDKMARAMLASAKMESGQVWFARNRPWSDAYEAEVFAFPRGAHDDQVDALAYACDQVGRRVYTRQLVSW